MKLKFNKLTILMFFVYLLVTLEIYSCFLLKKNKQNNDDNENDDNDINNKQENYISLPQNDESDSEEDEEFVKSEERISTSDMILQRVRGYIKSLATKQVERGSDLNLKKKTYGIVDDEFPKTMVKKASLIRNNKELWKKIMSYPTEIWRNCVYPTFNLNYLKFCQQSYALSNEYKLRSCNYNFCIVCCDQLKFHLFNTSEKNLIGHLLELSGTKGYRILNKYVDNNEIKACRKSCQENYQLDMPIIYPTPPRDETLGKTINNSAYSCSDIKKWGDENAKTGSYWVKVGSKGYRMVYCDMETDGGGWTLFFNYKHITGSDLILNSQKMPENLDENSHMYLSNAGFTEKDVKEVRFMCTEKYDDRKFFWHFKNLSYGVIDTALTGNQKNLNLSDFKEKYYDLPKPNNLVNYERSFDQNIKDEIDYIGNSYHGGFSETAFGSDKSYWTVRGSNSNAQRFECGTKHEVIGGFATPSINTEIIYTHHSIYFKGEPLSEDEARSRYMFKAKIKNY